MVHCRVSENSEIESKVGKGRIVIEGASEDGLAVSS